MINHPTQFLIDGVDRLGKSTLVQNLQERLGYKLHIHLSKPPVLKCYSSFDNPYEVYQHRVYSTMFNLITDGFRVIYDRTHLGEMVYAPKYRDYSGQYVLKYERQANTSNARLILLTTSDFSFIKDDGLSLDFSRKEEEQLAFVDAFNQSSIIDKRIIDVSDGQGGYKSPEEVLEEALKIVYL